MKRTDSLACARQVVIEIGRSLDGLGIQDFRDAIGLKSVSQVSPFLQQTIAVEFTSSCAKAEALQKALATSSEVHALALILSRITSASDWTIASSSAV